MDDITYDERGDSGIKTDPNSLLKSLQDATERIRSQYTQPMEFWYLGTKDDIDKFSEVLKDEGFFVKPTNAGYDIYFNEFHANEFAATPATQLMITARMSSIQEGCVLKIAKKPPPYKFNIKFVDD